MTTNEALYRAILDNPADDVARLVYADWLDDGAATVPCPKCKGRKRESYEVTREFGGTELVWRGCPACSGTGTVACERTARAEFVRAQCELARQGERCHCGETACSRCPLQWREARLELEHGREWARVPWGKGDAFELRPLASPQTREGRVSGRCHEGQSTPHYRRGFVERVEVPALSWVFERDESIGACRDDAGRIFYPEPQWRVTEWAIAIAKAHPVTRWTFWNGNVVGDLPTPLYEELKREPRSHNAPACSDNANLLDALTLAAGRVVRRAAGFAE